MTSVSRKEGFRYGFHVFVYWLVLLGLSAALVAAGGWVVSQQPLEAVGANQEGALLVAGAFVAFLGVLVFGSGQVGLAYKLVADGVETGVRVGTVRPSGSVGESDAAPAGSPETAEDPDAGPPEAAGQQGETDTGTGAGDHSAGEATHSVDEPTPRPRAGRSGQRADAAAGPAADADGAVDGGPGDSEPTARPAGSGREGHAPSRETGPSGDDRLPGPDADESPSERQGTDARPVGQGEPSDESEPPADVASESDIADELGFGSGEGESGTGPAGDAGPGGADPDPDRSTGSGEESPFVSPVDDEPVGDATRTETAAEAEDAEDEDDGTSMWTTGDDHMDGTGTGDDR